ncbi:VOC family protein [Stakelama marina]|uniref:VOC family protein n=1 Tax=Stakelama marina TaxID=2826939 RepID=A0A8T4IGW4_9SPHN|nr:VOC family protein [Stakelama marina]MBR0551519.1 VOC family protein [Stakelama marina]
MTPPPIEGLLETALYISDMERSRRFYAEMLGLREMLATDRLTAFDAGSRGVLLLFQQGATSEDSVSEAGTVPGHHGKGKLHMAFAIAAGSYDAWKTHLECANVKMRGEMRWPKGGRSMYFEDPDGHVLELATPGLWPNY